MHPLSEITNHLIRSKEGYWVSRESHAVSWPEEASELCFALEDDSFWFRHRNAMITTILSRYPPPGEIFDIGGGRGTLITAILQAYPNMRGVLFDQPHVVEGVDRILEAAGVAERCEIVAGDCFQSVPSGGDAYVLQRVLHGCEDVSTVTILKNCRTAMGEGGRIIVIDRVIPPGNEPSPGKIADLNPLVIVGGRERTQAEHRRLFDAAGFRLTNITPTQSTFSIIEGVPV